MTAPLLARGRAEVERLDRERAAAVAANIERGRDEVRRAFVFRFYHDTMLDTHMSGAYHKLGPHSPDPRIWPEAEPGPLGGQYHLVGWRFEWEGIEWRAAYKLGASSWFLNFYVRRRRLFRAGEWRSVSTPADVVEALS